MLFALCWIPYAIIVVADVNDTFTMEWHIFATLIAHTNSSLNSILYGLTNSSFRKGYMTLLGLHRCLRYFFPERRMPHYSSTNQLSSAHTDTTVNTKVTRVSTQSATVEQTMDANTEVDSPQLIMDN